MKRRGSTAALLCMNEISKGALRSASILGLFFICCVAAAAQNQRPAPVAPSELAQENMSLVAASPADIRAVLVKDPGLMVELKRWIAKDATDHGQIIGESDLTNDAVLDRLEADAHFRSVATMLLQRYGYLVPKVNPDSEEGKEQELLVQERVKWLAQEQEEELTAARQRSNRSTEQTGTCDPQFDRTCGATQARPSPVQGSAPQTQPQEPPSRTGPNESNPSTFPQRSGGPLEQAGLGGSDRLSAGDLSTISLGSGHQSGQFLDGAGVNPFGLLTPQAGARDSAAGFASLLAPPNPEGFSSIQNSPSNVASTAAGLAPSLIESSTGGVNSRATPSLSTLTAAGTQRYEIQAALQPVEMARKPNPYGDIPSLYDMYLQAAPHPTTPTRFGMDVFENGTRDPQLIPMDLPAGPDYVVGPGDGLAIDLWGGVSQRLYRTVDREGRVSLPEVGPVLVSGKSLADVQQSLQLVLRSQFRDVSADVSLSRLRTIRVYVVGDVAAPGAYDISSLSTPLNALFVAGGPTPRGSLRIVKHYRGNQLVQAVDLYDLLLHGVKSDIERLENGDTVLVPPIGPQVTVEGMVRRPAIYELKDEKDLNSVLDLAGGLLPTAALQHIEVQRMVAHERQTMMSLDIPDGADGPEATQKLASFEIHDGDQVRLFPIAPYNQNAVYLEGHVLRPGRYSYRADMRVTDVIASFKDLLPEPATQYAEIIRLNAPDFHPSVEGFDLAEAIDDPSHAPVLHPMDTVRIFSRFDFENPPAVSVWGDVRGPGTFRTSGQIRLSDAIHLAGGLSPDAQTGDAQVFRYLSDGKLKIFSVSLSEALSGDPTQNIILASRDRILVHRSPDAEQPATVYVQGEVVKPGRYPLTTNMTVADLIRVGGGLKPSADTQVGDLTHYEWAGQSKLSGEQTPIEIAAALSGDPKADVPLHNGDVVTIRQLPGWNDLGASIIVKGEVKHPGTYGIRPGERLSSVLDRAGGFQSGAYPYGAVLQRVQVRELEAKQQDEMVLRIKDAERDLELLPDTDPKQKQAKQAALAQYQTTLTQLSANPPVGRVNIRISSNINRWKNSSADIEVRAGDTLVIPKRPDYVMVTGQVFNPTAVAYRPGKSAKWYLSQSGGPTTIANKKDIFVIRADGSVIGGNKSMWSGESLSSPLQPGDTVVVPEKAVGGGPNWQNLFTSAQLASSIATTVLFAMHY
ncbi:MAG TPA: SLBB domain-containing protein [Candidatus Acidoferrales bacterium]|nr:SLBB domain-containing protein [Candidatus Acidoferrales bacterium]